MQCRSDKYLATLVWEEFEEMREKKWELIREMKRVNEMMGWLLRVPRWMLTVICSVAILWLTLAPKPIGDVEVPLFPGADKLVHAVMFGGLALCILLDTLRHGRRWRPFSWKRWFVAAMISSLAGLLIEYLQLYTELGRSFEWTDWLADSGGAFLLPLILRSLLSQKKISVADK